jgi:hypothetical protein
MNMPEDERRRSEREARQRCQASLAAALAGRDGGGHLKGASPTPLLARAQLELQQLLAVDLPDPDGCLRQVILRRLAGLPELLSEGVGHPAAVLNTWLDWLLSRPAAVKDLVRETDMVWGERYQERPRFEREGQPPIADDPYTVAQVTATLANLRERLALRG